MMTNLPTNQTEPMPRDVAAQAAVGAIEGALDTVRKMMVGSFGMETVHYETAVAGLGAARDYAIRYLLGKEPD
ncbi:MAG: hypothetical protein KC449_31115, partial [Anaerolineales bacterium]|nr:hypothetical protein [Anaerolineales bacterium]